MKEALKRLNFRKGLLALETIYNHVGSKGKGK